MTYHGLVSEPAAIHDEALHNIRYIREAMERASAFTSIPGWGGLAVGVTAVVTASIAAFRTAQPRLWVMIWLVEAIIAATIAAMAMLRKMRRAGVSFRAAPTRRFFTASAVSTVWPHASTEL